MTKDDIIRKLTSRKFWLAVAGFVASMIIATRGDAETAETVSGLIMSGATVIAYIVGEGMVDAESTAAAGTEDSPAGGTPSGAVGASSAGGTARELARLKRGSASADAETPSVAVGDSSPKGGAELRLEEE